MFGTVIAVPTERHEVSEVGRVSDEGSFSILRECAAGQTFRKATSCNLVVYIR